MPAGSRNARKNAVLSVPAKVSLIGRRGYPVVWDDDSNAVDLTQDDMASCCGVLLSEAEQGRHVSIATLGYAGTLFLKIAGSVERFSPLKLSAMIPEPFMLFGAPVDGIHGPDTYVAIALEAGSPGAMIEAALLPQFFHDPP
ncbi:MAG: hypothetical protein JJU00_19990 [Opitutales bacterium]|nr:hypothetical protein [Opitutales bacterium]